MSSFLIDLKEIYREYFPNNFKVEDKVKDNTFTSLGSPIKEKVKGDYLGREVFLPVRLVCGGKELSLPCATIRITGQKTIIRTAISERRGTVKEQFSVGDYEFTVNGVMIAQENRLPDEDMLKLKNFFESTSEVELHNAVSDLFLDSSCRVCITGVDFPEVQGKTLRHRPFSFTCESDFVNTLVIDN